MTSPSPLPQDSSGLAEPQYRFGVGPVVVHSVKLVAEVAFDNQLWFHLKAMVANGNVDRHGGFVDRELYVDARALPSKHSIWHEVAARRSEEAMFRPDEGV